MHPRMAEHCRDLDRNVEDRLQVGRRARLALVAIAKGLHLSPGLSRRGLSLGSEVVDVAHCASRSSAASVMVVRPSALPVRRASK